MKPKTIACALPELAADTTRQRVQVFPNPGEYVHPAAGPFTLTADHLAEYAADIEARDSISVDRDHSFLRGNGSRAAGWVVQGTAELTDDGLYADVEWTPQAADEVRAKEYRYLSPEFNLVAHAQPDGKVVMEPKLNAVSLTNRPFFSMMEPLAADELALEDALMVADALGDDVADTLLTISAGAAREVIAAAAAKGGSGRVAYADPGYRKDGKPRYPLTSAEEVAAAWKSLSRSQVAATYEKPQLTRIKARIKRAATKFGVTVGADESTKKEKTMELTEALAADLGVAVDASDEEILAAMQKVAADNKALAAKVPADGVVTIGADELASLKASAEKTDTLAASLLANRKKTALETAVATFRIAASEEEFYGERFDENPDAVEKFLAEKTPIMASVHGSSKTVNADGETVDTSPVTIGGSDYPVGEDSAKAHAATLAILAKSGKTLETCTADEYANAALQAVAAVA